jgi:CBS-domain-containing membrane protein
MGHEDVTVFRSDMREIRHILVPILCNTLILLMMATEYRNMSG